MSTNQLENFNTRLENPLKEFLDQSKNKLQNIQISEVSGTQPGIPYEGKCINIPQNLLRGTEYSIGFLNPQNQGLSSLITNLAKITNNIMEIITFIAIYQNPLIKQVGQKGIDTTENTLRKIEELFEKNLKEQIEQLEVNRKNITESLKEVQSLAKREYETLLEHQKSILDLIQDKKNNLTEEKIDEKIEKLKISLEEKQENLEEQINKVILGIEKLNNRL